MNYESNVELRIISAPSLCGARHELNPLYKATRRPPLWVFPHLNPSLHLPSPPRQYTVDQAKLTGKEASPWPTAPIGALPFVGEPPEEPLTLTQAQGRVVAAASRDHRSSPPRCNQSRFAALPWSRRREHRRKRTTLARFKQDSGELDRASHGLPLWALFVPPPPSAIKSRPFVSPRVARIR
jgi:hypothetical protein